MSLGIGLAMAALWPVIVHTLPNPITFVWHFKNGFVPPPPEVEKRAEGIGYVLALVESSALGIISWGLLRNSPLGDDIFAASTLDPVPNLCYGLLSGFAWMVLMALTARRASLTRERLARHQLIRSPLSFTFATFVVGAPAEELWRAFCMLSLAPAGNVLAVLTTGLAFGLAHAESRARFAVTTLAGFYLGWLFITTRSLIATTAAHLAMNAGLLLLIRVLYSRANPRR
jgi:membrane protease YdiL (CAAX protease family)